MKVFKLKLHSISQIKIMLRAPNAFFTVTKSVWYKKLIWRHLKTISLINMDRSLPTLSMQKKTNFMRKRVNYLSEEMVSYVNSQGNYRQSLTVIHKKWMKMKLKLKSFVTDSSKTWISWEGMKTATKMRRRLAFSLMRYWNLSATKFLKSTRTWRPRSNRSERREGPTTASCSERETNRSSSSRSSALKASHRNFCRSCPSIWNSCASSAFKIDCLMSTV